jgi:hypothetical protein
MLGAIGGTQSKLQKQCHLTIRSSRTYFVPAKIMAKKACHVFASTTQVGLTHVLGPMKLCLILLAVSSIASFGCHSAVKPERLSPRQLFARRGELLHSTVAVRGCLVDEQHGAYIFECGSRGENSLTLVSDPKDKIPETFMKRLGHLRGELPANITDRLVEIDDPDGENKHAIYLEIQTITIADRHEP